MSERMTGASSPPTSHSRPLVLLVGIAVLARLELAALLEEGGFQPVAVTSAEEVLEVLGAIPGIAALVMEARLSSEGLDGYALARKVRERWRIGVVVVSGQGGPAPDQLPPDVHFLAKPVHGPTLVHLVRGGMERGGPVLHRLAVRETGSETRQEVSGLWSMTPRQQEVLELMVQGRSNRDIAQELNLSENTVKVHVVSIFRKLGVSNRTEAVLAGLRYLDGKASKPS